MRKFFFLIILLNLLILPAFSQGELPVKDGKVFYEYIDSSVNGNLSELYNRSKLWFAETFRDSKEVIQVDDKETGMIVGKGLFKFTQGIAPYNVRFTVKLNIKDNKYRGQFYDIIVEAGTSRYEESAETWNKRKGYDKIKNKIKEGFASIIEGLNKSMQKKEDTDF